MLRCTTGKDNGYLCIRAKVIRSPWGLIVLSRHSITRWNRASTASLSISGLNMRSIRLTCTYRIGNGVDGLRDTAVLLLLCRGAIFALVIGICAEKKNRVMLLS